MKYQNIRQRKERHCKRTDTEYAHRKAGQHPAAINAGKHGTFSTRLHNTPASRLIQPDSYQLLTMYICLFTIIISCTLNNNGNRVP